MPRVTRFVTSGRVNALIAACAVGGSANGAPHGRLLAVQRVTLVMERDTDCPVSAMASADEQPQVLGLFGLPAAEGR